MFIWRANIPRSSGKGHEYFLRHLLGTQNSVLGQDLGELGDVKPREIVWRDSPGKARSSGDAGLPHVDNVPLLGCRSAHGDLVREKRHDTSDMHTFIHPFAAAVDPDWETRPDWDIFRTLALKFSQAARGVLGKEKDLVFTAILHDSPAELGQATDVKEWKRGECEIIPGKTTQAMTVVERDYPNVGAMYTALGPLVSTIGAGGKGISWDAKAEVEYLGRLNGTASEPGHRRRPRACGAMWMPRRRS